MTPQCPVCSAEQSQSLLCASCTQAVEQALAETASLHDELLVTKSKQARVTQVTSSGPSKPRPLTADDEESGSSLKHERSPINLGAVAAADHLTDILASWARDVSNDQWRPTHGRAVMVQAAWLLLAEIDAIRRHPAVEELMGEVLEAVGKARWVIDRAPDRVYVGPCLVEGTGEHGEPVVCEESVYASPEHDTARCRTCGADHVIADRRGELMENAGDRIVTVRHASQYIGWFGDKAVNQKTIRTWLDRDKLTDQSGGVGERTIRLGDLWKLLVSKTEKAA